MHQRNSDIYIIHYDMANVHGFYHFRSCRSLLHALENKHSQFMLELLLLLLLLLGLHLLGYVPLETATVVRVSRERIFFVFFKHYDVYCIKHAIEMQTVGRSFADEIVSFLHCAFFMQEFFSIIL